MMFALQLNLILLPQPTDALNGYPSPVYPMLHVNWSAFLHANPSKSRLEQWHQWRTPIGWWGPRFSATASVAYK